MLNDVYNRRILELAGTIPRIGRLDRIGQTETIRIHVPHIAGSADEIVVEWYHRGIDAFEVTRSPVQWAMRAVSPS